MMNGWLDEALGNLASGDRAASGRVFQWVKPMRLLAQNELSDVSG